MTLQSAGSTEWEEARRLGPWFHNLHLPDGSETAPDHPLGDFPSFKWRQIAPFIPIDLDGLRVLDIGCNAGFYAFEMAGRGADVLAIDHDQHYLAQARWASEHFDLTGRVQFECMGVYDLAGLAETFDIVLFLGVLYHLRYPLLGLDLVAERVADAGSLVLQTLTSPGGDPRGPTPDDLSIDDRASLRDQDWPAMAFVEHHLAGDHTNWWVPTAGAVEAMVRTTGLAVVDRPGHEIWICRRERESHHLDELHRATRRSDG
ncbi:MAG: Methyltransferase type 11 [Ilumatobacteraceae bacterium]|nr:Methyltransferase type 11 [Ilumatobacteraceae bacterium]